MRPNVPGAAFAKSFAASARHIRAASTIYPVRVAGYVQSLSRGCHRNAARHFGPVVHILNRKRPLIHARLGPGEENSGKLVTLVRQKPGNCRKEHRDIIITDGPRENRLCGHPSLSGADSALMVTEPSLSAIHDLERVPSVCERFSVPSLRDKQVRHP